MTNNRKCTQDCTCGRHARRLNLTDEERAQRHRDQSRSSMQKYYKSSTCPSCEGPKTPQSELCQTCRRKEQSANSQTEEERSEINREYMRNRRATDHEYVERQREYQKVHGRKYQMKSKYGVTLEQWDEILRSQSGRCYLCEDPLKGGRTDIHIDHDHSCCPGKKTCGKCIRGLACQKCNQGIGQFNDDPERMIRVANNLRKVQIATR